MSVLNARIALVGDLHEGYRPAQYKALDAGGFDIILFTGDLPTRTHRRLLTIAGQISNLNTPCFVLPGNHDGPSPLAVLRATLGLNTNRPSSTRRHVKRLNALQQALSPHTLVGFSKHELLPGLWLIAGRPHSMGGLHFSNAITQFFGVSPTDKTWIKQISEGLDHQKLLYLAHNGPANNGLTKRFHHEFGGKDAADHVQYLQQNYDLAAVLFGHLHHRGHRPWRACVHGVWHTNAAIQPNPGPVVLQFKNGRLLKPTVIQW